MLLRSFFLYSGLLSFAVFCWPDSAKTDELAAPPKLAVSAIVGATTDYVYRGVSLTGERPTPLLFVEASYGIAYFNGVLIGAELGDDALGRSIGNIEADATFGVAPSIAGVDFNLGFKYTGYPNGRDVVVGTLLRRERDFVEYFAGAKVKPIDGMTLGGTAFWTPDFYDQTDDVWTLEAQATLALPAVMGVHARLTSGLGRVKSAERDVVAPGRGYAYFNAGVEGQIDKLVFDLRYWDTDVQRIEAFDRRVVLSVGIKFE